MVLLGHLREWLGFPLPLWTNEESMTRGEEVVRAEVRFVGWAPPTELIHSKYASNSLG